MGAVEVGANSNLIGDFSAASTHLFTNMSERSVFFCPQSEKLLSGACCSSFNAASLSTFRNCQRFSHVSLHCLNLNAFRGTQTKTQFRVESFVSSSVRSWCVDKKKNFIFVRLLSCLLPVDDIFLRTQNTSIRVCFGNFLSPASKATQ